MNTIKMRFGLFAVAVLAALSIVGCSDKAKDAASGTTSQTGPANTPDPGSKVIGVTPAPPTKEAPATTSPVPSTVTKTEQSKSMPLPGQANDHSTLAKNPSQKAGATGK